MVPANTLPTRRVLQFVGLVEQIAGACASTGMVYVMHVVGAQTLLAGTGADAVGPWRDALEAMAAGRHPTTLADSDRGSRGHFCAQVSHAVRDGHGVVGDADKTWRCRQATQTPTCWRSARRTRTIRSRRSCACDPRLCEPMQLEYVNQWVRSNRPATPISRRPSPPDR